MALVMNIRRRQEQKRPEKSTDEGQAENTICLPPAYSHVNTGLIQFFSRCLFDTVHCLNKRPLSLYTVRHGKCRSQRCRFISNSRTVFSYLALSLWEIPLEQWVG